MSELKKHDENKSDIFLLHEFLEWLQFTRKLQLIEQMSIAPVFGYEQRILTDDEIRTLASEFFGIDYEKYEVELFERIDTC